MVEEKKSLGKREKILLFIMIVVGLFALMVVYVIIPLYNQLGDLQQEHGTLQLEKSRIDAMLATEQNIRDNRTQAIEKHMLDSSRFLNESHASEIGRMLTLLCRNHGLIPVNQRLEDPVDFVIEENNGSGNSGGDTVFLITSATMTLEGIYTNLINLLDTIKETDYLRVSSLNYTWARDSVSFDLDRITIGFEVTMIKNVDYSKAEIDEGSQDDQDDDNWHGLDMP